jgi:hypothetical protein
MAPCEVTQNVLGPATRVGSPLRCVGLLYDVADVVCSKRSLRAAQSTAELGWVGSGAVNNLQRK